jgi:Helix-turn-helix domain
MGTYPLDRNSAGAPDPLLETAQELGEAKRILEGIEATALSSVAQVLAEVTESLSRTAKDLTDIRAVEWMTAEQAAKHLGCESVKAFEKIASREGIPKHYLSARVLRYNRTELDAWLMSRKTTACPR